MPHVLTFAEAIEEAREGCGRELAVLLGNGFSIDYDAAVFRYESLAREARLGGLSVAKAELFDTLGTENFEVIIEKLSAAAKLQELYGGDAALTKTLRRDVKVVRNALADVIAKRHPESAQDLSDDEVAHARTFLAHFRRIFSLNYDLLLYWVVNRIAVLPHGVPIRDGFEYPSYKDQSMLVWKSKPSQGPQRVFYLHGALHYFRGTLSVGDVVRTVLVKISGSSQFGV